MNDDDLVLVLTTMPDDDRAEAFAATLVSERLAACVTISAPILSVYRWKGTIEREAERQVAIKTRRRLLPALAARVRTLHPYEVPEWIALDVEASSAYAAWLRDATGADATTR